MRHGEFLAEFRDFVADFSEGDDVLLDRERPVDEIGHDFKIRFPQPAPCCVMWVVSLACRMDLSTGSPN